jgi:hypothetical protein
MARLETITGSDPAAGAEVAYTVPAAVTLKLIAVRFSLVTSATAATRTVQLIIDDGTDVLWRRISPATQTASLTRQYLFLADLTVEDSAFDANGDVKLFLPSLPIDSGWRIRTLTSNIQSGDNFGAPMIHAMRLGAGDEIGVEA